MIYLVDTHILLWLLFSPEKIKGNIQQIFQKSDDSFYVSKISFWEISIKYSLGKLDLEKIKPEELEEKTKESGFEILDIESKDFLSYYNLPMLDHKDPFDRLIIWQSIKNNMTLISRDKKFEIYTEYGLKIIS